MSEPRKLNSSDVSEEWALVVPVPPKKPASEAFPTRNFTEIGDLLSYGPNFPISYRQRGYAGKILKGARPLDLPVIGPTTMRG